MRRQEMRLMTAKGGISPMNVANLQLEGLIMA